MFASKNLFVFLAAFSISRVQAAPAQYPALDSATRDIKPDSGSIIIQDTWQCCSCTNGKSRPACNLVGFGMCDNRDSCGIWVGHDRDLDRFGEACRACGGNLEGCRYVAILMD